jgi:hypothetical protein
MCTRTNYVTVTQIKKNSLRSILTIQHKKMELQQTNGMFKILQDVLNSVQTD